MELINLLDFLNKAKELSAPDYTVCDDDLLDFIDIVLEDDFVFGMVTNSLQVGGIKHGLGTAISLKDGLFDVFLVKKPKNASGYQNIISAFITQNLDKTEDIINFKASKLKFESDTSIPWTLDGEFGGDVSCAEIINLPRAFSVIV